MTTDQRRHIKRNFTLGVLNGALVNLGLAFIDPFTVIPVFITRLGGSSVLVGLTAAVFGAGWFFPQAFVAPLVETRRRVLPIYNAMSLVRLAGFAVVIAAVFGLGSGRPHLLLAAILAGLAINTLAAGVSGVPFLEVTSKAFPANARGTFFGTRRFFGGALGVFAGVLVAIILGTDQASPGALGAAHERVAAAVRAAGLQGRAFPDNYGVLFALGAVCAALGYAAFSMVREIPAQTVHPHRSLRAHLDEGFALLRRHANYRLFLWVRVCWQMTAMAFPFYAIYAFVRLGFSEASVGVFVSVWVGAGVVSNFAWGRLLDRKGNRLVMVATAAIAVLPPVAMLLLGRASDGHGRGAFLVLCAAFLVNGAARAGRFITNLTYLLEFVPQDHRPRTVGFMNTISSPFMLSPVVGGLLVQAFGFEVLFGASALFALISIAVSARLAEPRAERYVGPTVVAP
ncbi:MAG: MFS transporter [Candidatus Krumholzibacteria bacterium]|nr:MFS transporter [Candidatus Krumholzibacteria bacterium]